MSCLVSIPISSQLLLFLELQLECQFQETFPEPQVITGRHTEIKLLIGMSHPINLKLLKDGNGSSSIVYHMPRVNPNYVIGAQYILLSE